MLCTNYGRLQEETSCVGQNRGVAIMKRNIWLDGMMRFVKWELKGEYTNGNGALLL